MTAVQHKLKVGITGQSGFLGSLLFHTLNSDRETYQIIPFKDSFFDDAETLQTWVSECEVIIHFAGMMRHIDPQYIYETNVRLVEKLIDALEMSESTPHILFASSSQETLDNHYGRSKKIGRIKLGEWAKKNNAVFTGMILPNIFGPFGTPFFNSFIATFCYQLTHGEKPIINVDASIKLLYSGDFIEIIKTLIQEQRDEEFCIIPHSIEKKVSDVLCLLMNYQTEYYYEGNIPEITSEFEFNLFNTFRSYIDYQSYFPVFFDKIKRIQIESTEILLENGFGKLNLLFLKSGESRGNFYRRSGFERIFFLSGSGKVELRRIGTNQIISFIIPTEIRSYIDIPLWYTYNIINIGNSYFYYMQHFKELSTDGGLFLETV